MDLSGAELLLAILALGVGVMLARGCSPVVGVLIFVSALVVSVLLFLPGAQLVELARMDQVRALEQLASVTPLRLSDWVHLLVFFWLALLLRLGHSGFRSWKGAGLLVALAVAAELAQWLTEGREPRVLDVVLNVIGAAAGMGAAALIRRTVGRS